MSDDDDEEVSTLCAELEKKHSKGLKDEARKVFMYERCFVQQKEGVGWGAAPDPGEALSFAEFAQDPSRVVFSGAPGAEWARPRLVFISTDRFFTDAYKTVGADAVLRIKQLGDASKNTKIDFTKEHLAAEVLLELAAMWLHLNQLRNGVSEKRPIEATVGLLRQKTSVILQMSPHDLKNHRGRSWVTLGMQFAAGPPEPTTPSKRPREGDETSSRMVSRPVATPTKPGPTKPRLTLRDPDSRCTRCTGRGHVEAACNIPPGMCLASWTCFLCGGKGHALKFCPSPAS